MYKSKLAVAIKSGGRVLRESGDTVYIPFGCEYSILIKNLNNVRALVSISVDGVDIGDGTEFVVHGNRDVNIERFIKNGNFNEGNRLKFIERTAGVEAHRGVGIEDGLIRVEYKFEKIMPTVRHFVDPGYDNTWYNNGSPTFGTRTGDGTNVSRGISNGLLGKGPTDSANYSFTSSVNASVNASVNNVAPVNDAGVTVAGSVSGQQFREASYFATEMETHVIVLKMLGQTEDNRRVEEPLYVRAKPRCTSCGRVNKASAKFCQECGTSLVLV